MLAHLPTLILVAVAVSLPFRVVSVALASLLSAVAFQSWHAHSHKFSPTHARQGSDSIPVNLNAAEFLSWAPARDSWLTFIAFCFPLVAHEGSAPLMYLFMSTIFLLCLYYLSPSGQSSDSGAGNSMLRFAMDTCGLVVCSLSWSWFVIIRNAEEGMSTLLIILGVCGTVCVMSLTAHGRGFVDAAVGLMLRDQGRHFLMAGVLALSFFGSAITIRDKTRVFFEENSFVYYLVVSGMSIIGALAGSKVPNILRSGAANDHQRRPHAHGQAAHDHTHGEFLSLSSKLPKAVMDTTVILCFPVMFSFGVLALTLEYNAFLL
jgi:hypothetical protein